MRIGILTFHEANNFGSILQTYGLYKAVEDLGGDVEIINYHCDEIINREFKFDRIRFNSVRDFLKSIYFGKSSRLKHKHLSLFLSRHSKISQDYNKNTIAESNDCYDTFLVGSDLVWATDVTNLDFTYFLDFVNSPKCKASFASSANDILGDVNFERIKSHLESFSYIAVRETNIKEQIETFVDSEVSFVCDPTMLIDQTYWSNVANESKFSTKKKYILMYFLDKEEKMLEDAKRMASELDYDIIYITSGRSRKGVKTLRVSRIEDFLYLIKNAEIVLTSSYHGILFSMYFERQFYYYVRAHSSRMKSLSQKLDIEDRQAMYISKRDSIDYEIVNKRIENFRSESLKVLEKIIGKENGNL